MASRPDLDAQDALAAPVRREVNFAYLDLDGDPLRLTDAPYNVTFSGTGDIDLDTFTFLALDPALVSIGQVQVKETGTETVTLQLSGLSGLDDDVMNELGDRSKFQGRDCRLWKMMRDPASLAPIGGVWSYFTGYMSSPKIAGDARSQVINLEVETWLAFLGQASNRTYLDQPRYDPGDLSGELAIAIANGANQRGDKDAPTPWVQTVYNIVQKN